MVFMLKQRSFDRNAAWNCLEYCQESGLNRATLILTATPLEVTIL